MVKAARRARRSGAPADFHRLRIRCKRLRYSLEFTAGIYGGRTERFTKRLAKLQDALGLMQDAEVATARLLDLAVGAAGGGAAGNGAVLPARTVFAMGAVAERYRAESAALLAKMPKHLGVLDGDDWRSLASHMARRQAEAEAEAPEEPGTAASRSPRPVPRRPGLPPVAAEREPVALPPVAAEREPVALPPVAAEREPVALPPVAAGPSLPMPAAVPPATGPGAASPVAAALAAWPDVAWGPPAGAPSNGAPRDGAPPDGAPPASTGRTGTLADNPAAPADERPGAG